MELNMKKIIILLACFALLSPAYAKQGNKNKKQKSLPPGLEKKIQSGKELPPGWQKKIVKGEVLDKDVYHNAVIVTREERYRLPPSPVGTKLLKIENKIIRVMDATRTILDVFEVGKENR
jgi:hypothetical protein